MIMQMVNRKYLNNIMICNSLTAPLTAFIYLTMFDVIFEYLLLIKKALAHMWYPMLCKYCLILISTLSNSFILYSNSSTVYTFIALKKNYLIIFVFLLMLLLRLFCKWYMEKLCVASRYIFTITFQCFNIFLILCIFLV